MRDNLCIYVVVDSFTVSFEKWQCFAEDSEVAQSARQFLKPAAVFPTAPHDERVTQQIACEIATVLNLPEQSVRWVLSRHNQHFTHIPQLQNLFSLTAITPAIIEWAELFD